MIADAPDRRRSMMAAAATGFPAAPCPAAPGPAAPGPAVPVAVNAPIKACEARHVFLWGRGTEHEAAGIVAPVSIKSVVRGEATWESGGRRFVLDPGASLVLDEEQPYTIRVQARDPVETFCLFFRRGFVEEIGGVLTGGAAKRLDRPDGAREQSRRFAAFPAHDERLLAPLRRAHQALAAGRAEGEWLLDVVVRLGEALVLRREDVRRDMARVPAAGAATRAEIVRRLRRALDRIEDDLAGPLALETLAGAACLSPYHFHRLFTQVHGATPHQFVRERRLLRARVLLTESDWPVAEVARGCGFESPGSFSALYRRRFGAPPSARR